MITKTFTATIGVGAGTAYIRPALLDFEEIRKYSKLIADLSNAAQFSF